ELGRRFAADEVDGQNENVVILSHSLWERRYGGDANILGKVITAAGAGYTVVGVMPKGVAFPHAVELWAPLTLTADQRRDRRSQYIFNVGRLKPTTNVDGADAEVRRLAANYAVAFPETAATRLRAVSLVRSLSDDITRTFIFTLFGAALL